MKMWQFSFRKWFWRYNLQTWGDFVSASNVAIKLCFNLFDKIHSYMVVSFISSVHINVLEIKKVFGKNFIGILRIKTMINAKCTCLGASSSIVILGVTREFAWFPRLFWIMASNQQMRHGIFKDRKDLTHLPWTKCPPFRRRHFQVRFHEWKILYFASIFTEVCSQGSNWHYSSINSYSGLELTRRQAIIWTNVDTVHRRKYMAHGENKLEKTDLILQSVINLLIA